KLRLKAYFRRERSCAGNVINLRHAQPSITPILLEHSGGGRNDTQVVPYNQAQRYIWTIALQIELTP
ncbi:MAG: hypothetical protein IJR45_00455, partial [Firmicutes bacterium]|nr:hypothetical protein [Bacillota bacterium]